MEVMNPEFKEEMMKIEEEEKNFELDFDLSKIPIYVNVNKILTFFERSLNSKKIFKE